MPQEERTRAMRARLLEATVELLVERGFSGTSTTLVSERAGVSRGAQLHHFPTKNDLVVAAVEHLTEVRGAELAAAAAAVPTPRSTRAVLDLLGDHFTSPVFTAALELWVAARTDADLMAAVGPLEQKVGREVHRLTVERIVSTYVSWAVAHPALHRLAEQDSSVDGTGPLQQGIEKIAHQVVELISTAVELLGVDETAPGARELVQATLDLVRGLGLANTITDDRRRREAILDRWALTLDATLTGRTP